MCLRVTKTYTCLKVAYIKRVSLKKIMLNLTQLNVPPPFPIGMMSIFGPHNVSYLHILQLD